MEFGDVSLVGLRVFREVAERGTFTAAAGALGYTQSAVSRQVAAVERAAGARLFERRRSGVRLTAEGRVVVRRAAAVLAEIDAAARELQRRPVETGRVRLGAFTSAGAVLLPMVLTALRRTHTGIVVTTREGTTPALVRALRAGSVDLALLASGPPFRAPDAESPALELETLAEHSLRVAVPVTHPLAAGDAVEVADLRGQQWIASRSTGEETLLGAWPGLEGRPEIVHTTRDWLSKLRLVAAGCGITTIPSVLTPAVPPGVRVLRVRGGPRERRRLVLARLPAHEPAEPPADPVARVAEAVRVAVAEIDPA
jgi:DNA-binding transcriptional LysR family regulator